MINNTVLVGRLTKDPDLRYTNSGEGVATFTLAVNRSFTSSGGNREADFINCVIWRKSAETLAKYCKKGSLIGVVGRIQTRNYENQKGQRVYVTEVVCGNYQMLEKKLEQHSEQQYNGHQPSNQPITEQGSSQPSLDGMNQYGSNIEPFSEASQIDIDDEDLPF